MDPFQNQEDYWQGRLSGASLRIDLPFAQGDDTRRPQRQHVALDRACSRSIFALAERHGTSPGDIVLLAWTSLLARIGGVGTVWAATLGPDLCEGDDAWSRLTPVAVECPPGASAGDRAAGVHAARAEGRAQAGMPRARWEALLGLDAQAVGSGFQVGFVEIAGASGAASSVPAPLASCELVLQATVSDDALELDLVVQASPAETPMVGKLAAWLSRWIGLVVGAPAAPFDQLPLVSEEDLPALMGKGVHEADLPPGTCVHQLFEAQARRTPAATAVVDGARRLDYDALNRRANRLARHLQALGAGPDARVAIYLDRQLELVVAVLATLKAGAAYVPLDPAYPAERLRHTLADSAPVAVVTQASLGDGWAALGEAPAGDAPVLDLEADATSWDGLPETDLATSDTGVGPGHLAYVLYTSGSTGKPKGVAMPHAPLVNLVLWQNRQPGHDRPLRTLQFAALGFDVAFQEMFSTLGSGGELHLVDGDTRLSGDRLYAFIAEHRIERIFLPYFALQMLAEGHANASAGDGSATPACELREVVTAGEQLRIEPRIRAFFEAVPACRLHNHYGPTETHVVTALTLDGEPSRWPRLPSIGAPIDNARCYLLDANGQPVPEGVAGELYLAGPVVARGYLGRDDLTAERFLPDPFVDRADARMYRTGDLARWQADGTLEFLGRRDFQVKIRGFRIELGEVEAQVMACPGVREAGVVVREDTPGMKRLVAYFTALEPGAPVRVDRLRAHLLACLPDYMVPVAYVAMDAMPLSPNGKLDRARLPAPGRGRPDWAGAFVPARDAPEAALCRLFAEVLDLERIGRDDNFFDLGGTSLLALHLLQAIRREGLGEVGVTSLFRLPTPAGLARALADAGDTHAAPSRFATGERRSEASEPIAIIAMAGRFPGADDVEAFWENLCEGRDSIRFFSADELDPSIDLAERQDPSYVAARGVIDGVELFDAAFFGISPREAELMDPQQRIFLELCWACMERAGHVPGATAGPVGVFAGMYNASYFQKHVSAHPERIERLGAFQVMLDNEKDYIATRVAHKLDLTGPAISIHTACSTSLVAIAQAVDSLRAGRCDMALAGGASVTCPPNSGYRYQEGAMLSPDGHTRTFDVDAQGTVFCDGAAVVLLKRLSAALADGDPIHAVIRGVGINNDGGDKASFTAPSSEAQSAVVAMAHADAGVPARSIGYVEAHGTATPLGDPIEIEGLTRAFRRGTDARGFCRIGSVKSNVGHLLIAAGATGVIKTALSLEHETLPATLHFNTPNPALELDASPFVVNAERTPWPRGGDARRAGISSFGVGGTNAHVVLEEAPLREATAQSTDPKLLVLSARTPAALGASVERLAAHLDQHPSLNLDDVAWTLAVGRKAFAHRLALVASDTADAVRALRERDTAAMASRSRPARASQVVFMFPGQGATYARMGCALREREPAFREALDACADALGGDFGFDLHERLASDDPQALLPTSVMQPATFAIEYALARWWQARGVEPVAMIGHSVGEFVAATLAGIFSLEDAIRLVARRGALMQAQPPGGMLSVRIDEATLASRLPDGVSLAAENAPNACVVAGPLDRLAEFQAGLESDGIGCRLLHTSHAFHSAMMAPAIAPFRAAVDAVARHAPRCPIVSTTTGTWLDQAQAASADYWASHLREPVRFSRALLTALESPSIALLEVGPRTNLASLARMHPQVSRQHVPLVSSLSDGSVDESVALRRALGALWSAGVDTQPGQLDAREYRRRVRLPSYPFEGQRYWLDAPSATRTVVPHPAAVATQENPMPHLVPANEAASPMPSPAHHQDRRARLVGQLREAIEDVSGIDMDDAEPEANFIELGLDSLILTQVALQLQKSFGTPVTFRQLMSDTSTLASLADYLDGRLPAEAEAPAEVAPTPT
ncbi:polyketide synthase, partial [Marilutibacter aestuarii]